MHFRIIRHQACFEARQREIGLSKPSISRIKHEQIGYATGLFFIPALNTTGIPGFPKLFYWHNTLPVE